jgi:uncharacterized protein YlxW (UPF0749 family)
MKLRTIGIFVLCFVVGLSIMVQARATNGMQIYVSSQTISDYKTTIESEKKEIERINTLIADKKEALKEVRQLANGDSQADLKDRLVEERDYYRLISGDTNVKGEGVIILIDDGTRELYEGEDPNNVLVHDMDILIVLNELNRSGAEAISVNGERMSNISSISCSGYTIRINNQFFARPFEIRAVGDSKRMAAALVGPDGYGTLLQEYGILFRLTISDDMTISRYSEPRDYQYMSNLVKEKEGEEQ